jgi:hypothetical protein
MDRPALTAEGRRALPLMIVSLSVSAATFAPDSIGCAADTATNTRADARRYYVQWHWHAVAGMRKGIKSASAGGCTQQLGALERLQDVTVRSDLDGSLHSANRFLPLHVLRSIKAVCWTACGQGHAALKGKERVDIRSSASTASITVPHRFVRCGLAAREHEHGHLRTDLIADRVAHIKAALLISSEV